MTGPLEIIRLAAQGMLGPDQNLVAAALQKGGGQAVVLTYGRSPERWNVLVYAEGIELKGLVDDFPFGPDLDSMQRACSKFIELAAGYVREYPSWIKTLDSHRSPC